MARIHMLSLLSIVRVVMAATVDVTPDRTKMVDRQPNARLAKAHNHGMEAQIQDTPEHSKRHGRQRSEKSATGQPHRPETRRRFI